MYSLAYTVCLLNASVHLFWLVRKFLLFIIFRLVFKGIALHPILHYQNLMLPLNFRN